MKKKYLIVIIILIVLFVIGISYLIIPISPLQPLGCYVKNDVKINYIDLGGYNLYTCFEGCAPAEACTYLYAEKGGISKKLTKISDFSAIIKNIDGENGTREFLSKLGFFSDFGCFEINQDRYNDYVLVTKLEEENLCPNKICSSYVYLHTVLGKITKVDIDYTTRTYTLSINQEKMLPPKTTLTTLRYYDRDYKEDFTLGNFIAYVSIFEGEEELNTSNIYALYIKNLNQTEYDKVIKISVPNVEEFKINKTNGNFIIERYLGCYGNPDKIIKSLETVSKTGDYSFTIKELFYEKELLFPRAL